MKYLCVQCDDGGCILEVDPEPTRKPFSCPWEAMAVWVKQEEEERDEQRPTDSLR